MTDAKYEGAIADALYNVEQAFKIVCTLMPAGPERRAFEHGVEELAKRRLAHSNRANVASTATAPANTEDLRRAWREAGGEFHGPNVQTGTMTEEKLLPFLRKLIKIGLATTSAERLTSKDLPKVKSWKGQEASLTWLVESLESYSRIRPGADRDLFVMAEAAKFIRAIIAGG